MTPPIQHPLQLSPKHTVKKQTHRPPSTSYKVYIPFLDRRIILTLTSLPRAGAWHHEVRGGRSRRQVTGAPVKGH